MIKGAVARLDVPEQVSREACSGSLSRRQTTFRCDLDTPEVPQAKVS